MMLSLFITMDRNSLPRIEFLSGNPFFSSNTISCLRKIIAQLYTLVLVKWYPEHKLDKVLPIYQKSLQCIKDY